MLRQLYVGGWRKEKGTGLNAEKQTINLTCPVPVGCGRLAEGKGHETDC